VATGEHAANRVIFKQLLQAGAIDYVQVDACRLGGLNEALAEARKLARIPAAEKVGVRIYPQKKSFWDMIFDLADVKAQNPLDVRARLQVYKRFFPAMAMPFSLSCF